MHKSFCSTFVAYIRAVVKNANWQSCSVALPARLDKKCFVTCWGHKHGCIAFGFQAANVATMPADEPSEPPSAFADLDSEESTQLDENENSQVEVRKGGMPTWHGLGIGGDPLTYSNSLDLLSEDQKEIVALVKAHGIVKAMEMKGLCKKRKRQDTALSQ
jgi:hypothetical protein